MAERASAFDLRVGRVPGPPTVALRAWLLGGARSERTAGEALVTARMLTEGTARRGWRRLARESEERGQVIESFGGYEGMCIAVDALAHDLARALDDLAELILEPAWPAARFRVVKRQTTAEIESMLDRPEVRTARAYLRAIYADHPYGRPLQGTRAALRGLTPDDCRAFHRRSLGHGLVVTIAGELDEDEARRAAEERFATVSFDAAEPWAVEPPPEPTASTVTVALPRGDQAHVVCGRLTVPFAHPDRPALDLLGVALGAGTGVRGRLVDRIREREGLAYEVDVASSAGAGIDAGRFTLATATAPRQVARVERAVRGELERLIDHGLEDDEVDEARDYLIGSAPFRAQTARQVADRLAEEAIFAASATPEALATRWRAITPRDLSRAATRYLHPDRLTVAIGLPGTA